MHRLTLKDALREADRLIDVRAANAGKSTAAVLLDATDGQMTVRRADGATHVAVTIECDTHTPGSVAIDARTLKECVRAGEQQVTISAEGATVEINTGAAVTVPAGELTTEPTPDITARVHLNAAQTDQLCRVTTAAGTSEKRPVLNTVCLSDGHASATDSYRLHVADLDVNTAPLERTHRDDRPPQMLIPAGVITAMTGVAADGAEVVRYADGTVGLDYLARRGGKRTAREMRVSARTPETDGPFPDYTRVLGTLSPPVATVSTAAAALLEAVNATRPVWDTSANTPVALSCADGLTVSTKAGVRRAEVIVKADIDAEQEEVTVGFNPRFLAAAIDATGTETLTMNLRLTGPSLLTGGDVTVALMPVRLH